MSVVLPPNSIRNAPVSMSNRIDNIDYSKVDPQLKKAAESMESMFIQHMMQSMRKTVPTSDLSLESPATEIYRGMLDTEMSDQASNQGGVGMSRQIIANLMSAGYNNRVRPTTRVGGIPLKGQDIAQEIGGPGEGKSIK